MSPTDTASHAAPAGPTQAVQGIVSGTTLLYPHLGDPIDIVRSPFIYNPWFLGHGIDASLVPMGVSSAHLAVTVAGLRAVSNVRGLIVTMPHKLAIVPLLDSVSQGVSVAGSCNAVVKRADGSLHGELFDGTGFTAGLARKGFVLSGARCLLIGAGGVGSAIAAALAEGGCSSLSIHDRAPAATAALVDRVRAAFPAAGTHAGGTDPAGFDLVVNASPLGMNADDPLPVDVAGLAPSTFVGEVVMKRTMTPLLEAARARGCRFQVGTDMLYEQIPLYLELFGHGRPSPDELRAIA